MLTCCKYYDPETQQFLSRDPLEAASGQPYVYANRNPVNYADPDGAWAVRLWGQAGGKDKGDKGGMPPSGGGGAGRSPGPVDSRSGGSPQAAEAADRVRRVPTSAGKRRREEAGQLALEELYGPGDIGRGFETQYGKRVPDLVVERNGLTYAHESSVARGSVRAGTHKLQQALKDFELMQTYPGYTPIWHFWDGPPVANLSNTLREFGIRYVVYHP